MGIKNLKIQHYKSLSDVNIDLGQVTLIVGPNGSGKSNIIDAFRFISDLARYEIDHAVNLRGGVNMIRQHSSYKPYTISFQVEREKKHLGTVYVDSYNLKLSSSRRNDSIHIESEEFNWSELNEYYDEEIGDVISEVESHATFRDRDGFVKTDGEKDPSFQLPTDVTALGKSIFPERIGGSMKAYFLHMCFASVYPNIMREPFRLDTDRRLKEDCSNWGSIIRSLRSSKAGLESMERIIEHMQLVMPNLMKVRVNNAGGYLIPQFLVGEESKNPYYLDPIQLSDGTLRVFGILLSLYQKPTPTFIAIEEPEQTIHPALLDVLVHAIKEVSEEVQIVITTHSPFILDHFDMDDILVTDFTNGSTTVSRVSTSQLEIVKNKLMRISEIMALDGLKPEF